MNSAATGREENPIRPSTAIDEGGASSSSGVGASRCGDGGEMGGTCEGEMRKISYQQTKPNYPHTSIEIIFLKDLAMNQEFENSSRPKSFSGR